MKKTEPWRLLYVATLVCLIVGYLIGSLASSNPMPPERPEPPQRPQVVVMATTVLANSNSAIADKPEAPVEVFKYHYRETTQGAHTELQVLFMALVLALGFYIIQRK